MIEVDVRGLACPIPVVRTQKAMQENPKEDITVICDSKAAKENVARLAESRGYSVAEKNEGADFKILATCK